MLDVSVPILNFVILGGVLAWATFSMLQTPGRR